MSTPELTVPEMTDVLSASLVNVGRLLPDGMGISFFRGGDEPSTRMHVCWPDGSTTEIAVTGCSPIHKVQAVNAVAAIDNQEV